MSGALGERLRAARSDSEVLDKQLLAQHLTRVTSPRGARKVNTLGLG